MSFKKSISPGTRRFRRRACSNNSKLPNWKRFSIYYERLNPGGQPPYWAKSTVRSETQ